MNISCLQENLAQGLGIVSRGIGKEQSLPILSTILLKAEENIITLSSTNLEIGMRYTVRGKVEREGSVVVDAKLFTEFVQHLPNERISLVLENDFTLFLQCRNYSTKIRGSSPEDFPLFPSQEKNHHILCESFELRKALLATLFTVSIKEAPVELTGLLFRLSGNENTLTLVGTDSHRLAEYTLTLKERSQKEVEVIIPPRTLQELIRVLQLYPSSHCTLWFGQNQVSFLCESFECVSKVIQGSFPDYKTIIPTSSRALLTIEVAEWKKAVKAASVFSRSEPFDITCSFEHLTKEKGECVFFSSSNTFGENTIRLPIGMKGEQVKMILNYRFLLEGLEVFEDDVITLELTDAETPCVFHALKKKNYQYLLMPIRE